MIKSVAVYDIISCRMCSPLYVLCMYIVQLLGITFSSILHVHCVCAPPFFLPAVVSSLTFRNISHISHLFSTLVLYNQLYLPNLSDLKHRITNLLSLKNISGDTKYHGGLGSRKLCQVKKKSDWVLFGQLIHKNSIAIS